MPSLAQSSHPCGHEVKAWRKDYAKESIGAISRVMLFQAKEVWRFLLGRLHDVFKWEHPLAGGGEHIPKHTQFKVRIPEGRTGLPSSMLSSGSQNTVGRRVTPFGRAQYDGWYCQVDIIYYQLGNRDPGMPMVEFSDWVN